MQEVVEFLTANPVQYLATVGADGKAKCRPFMFLMEHEGKLWFGTNNQKTVFAEMQENPYVEVCASTPDFRWIRFGREGGVRGQSRRERSLHEHPHAERPVPDGG